MLVTGNLSTSIVKNSLVRPKIVPQPKDEAIRDYAYHLYEQSGFLPNRDLDNWLEATAILKINISGVNLDARLP